MWSNPGKKEEQAIACRLTTSFTARGRTRIGDNLKYIIRTRTWRAYRRVRSLYRRATTLED